MKKHIIILLILPFFMACEDIIDSDNLTNIDKKTSITGYLSPQKENLRIDISKVLPSLGTNINPTDFLNQFLIKNAEISISDNTNSIQLNYFSSDNYYTAQTSGLAISEGKDYFLNVKIDRNEYTASCKIPQRLNEINGEIKFRKNNENKTLGEIEVSFNDFANSKNFYYVKASYKLHTEKNGTIQQQLESNFYFENTALLSDDLQDGKKLSVSGEGPIFEPLEQGEQIKGSIIIEVFHVEEFLYKSLKTTLTNTREDSNPFVEYSITPNNITGENVIGIFAGYQVTKREVSL